MPYKVPVDFQNGSNYDYHFVIKELANKFEGQFQYLAENIEKYKTFSVPTEEEIIKIDEDGNVDIIIISYKMKFIDGVRFMASSLSNLVVNLAEGIHITKCKHYDCFLEKDSFNDISIKYKCLY